jgi:hypothetical protein
MNESEYYAGEFTDDDLNALANAGGVLLGGIRILRNADPKRIMEDRENWSNSTFYLKYWQLQNVNAITEFSGLLSGLGNTRTADDSPLGVRPEGRAKVRRAVVRAKVAH